MNLISQSKKYDTKQITSSFLCITSLLDQFFYELFLEFYGLQQACIKSRHQ